MEFPMNTNSSQIADWILRMNADQVPFAFSRALNDTAYGIRHEQRSGMEERFTIRRQWVLSGIQVTKRSTKHDLEAEIAVDESRDFLNRFEAGGRVTPRGSRFAIPDEARTTKAGVVSSRNRPRSFDFEFWGKGPNATVLRGNRRTFMVRRADGTGAILQRMGRRGSGKLRTLFTFATSAELPASMEFEVTAERVLQSTFRDNFEMHFDRAMRTARL